MQTIKLSLIFVYIVLLLIPLYSIFSNSGGLEGLKTVFSNREETLYLLLRLFGLYAIILFFIQLLIGAFMFEFRKLFGGKMLQFHITQGIIAYLVIIFHPIVFVLFNANTQGWNQALLQILPQLGQSQFYLNFGRLALILFTIGVAAGYFRRKALLTRHWRKFHILNYFAFLFALLHSSNLGSDTSFFPFNILYPIFWIGLFSAFFYRRIGSSIKLIRRTLIEKSQTDNKATSSPK